MALYLMTCQSSNMIGLYYLPLPTLVHETGIPFEGASKALRSLSDIGFLRHDEDNDLVWVVRMVVFQVGERLKPTDKQCKGIQRQLDEHVKSMFYSEFMDMYGAAFNLQSKGDRSPSEAPSKPLARVIEAPPKPESSEQRAVSREQEHRAESKNTPLPPKGGEEQIRRGLNSKKPNERLESLAAIIGKDAAATFRPARELTSAKQVREEHAWKPETEQTLNALLGVKPKPVERSVASEPVHAARIFLDELHDEFARSFSAPPAMAKARDNWEDPLAAWTRCFEHVRVGSVEAAEGRDTELVVILETPKPRDLKDGLEKYKAKVANAMKKAFGREVQLVPRLEAA